MGGGIYLPTSDFKYEPYNFTLCITTNSQMPMKDFNEIKISLPFALADEINLLQNQLSSPHTNHTNYASSLRLSVALNLLSFLTILLITNQFFF